MSYPNFDGTQACATEDLNMFFYPDSDEASPETLRQAAANYKKAIAVCGTCSWAEKCLEYALTVPDLVGVWGGTTERQRIRIRMRKRVA